MIRALEPADAPVLVGLIHRLVPAWVLSEDGLRHWLETQPDRARHAGWVALEEGALVGWAESRLRWEFGPEVAAVFVGVHPDHRRRGIGGRLYELAETHVAAAKRLYAESDGGDDARRFLLARGYREDRAERVSVLDPRAVDPSLLRDLEEAKRREGFGVFPLAEVVDRGPELHRLFETVDADAPHSEPLAAISYEEWRALVFDQPDLDHEASFVVLAPDGRAVAFSWLLVDRGRHRAAVEMTGTLREFRRRGLARLAKLATIRWAGENGITAIYAGNDTENQAMLALNGDLGFEPSIVYQDFVKELR
ncbi:MAG TPA: GNAT family N-acetyltransferase [Gaiellaceae bacterium]|nr:GNAT family N-acetyltransferase [Gaiellaceae bacterium]